MGKQFVQYLTTVYMYVVFSTAVSKYLLINAQNNQRAQLGTYIYSR